MAYRLIAALISTARRAIVDHPRFAAPFPIIAAVLLLLPTFADAQSLGPRSPDASFEQIAEQTTTSPDDTLIGSMVSQVEGYLKQQPNDGHGWEALAPIYMRQGRYEESAQAWQKAIANLGDSADREAGLGESLVAAANGTVTEQARQALNRAVSMDPESVIARYYLGLAAKQDGHPRQAAKIWRELLAAAPPDADWVDTVHTALAQLEASPPVATGSTSPADHDNASMLAMVERLAERLNTQGGDVDSWIMLVRSYETLGQAEKAVTAIARARLALAADPEKLSSFDQLLGSTDRASTPTAAEKQQSADSAADSGKQQTMMIEGMVARLAERLKQDGHDVEGWLRLMRSYVVLGQRDQASAAARSARLALANDTEALRRIDAGAKELGVDAP